MMKLGRTWVDEYELEKGELVGPRPQVEYTPTALIGFFFSGSAR